MGVMSGIVLFAVIWFLTLFIVLPLRLTTQGEAGQVQAGTHASAPQDPQMRKRLGITTAIAAVLWLGIAGVILSGVIRIEHFDFFYQLGR